MWLWSEGQEGVDQNPREGVNMGKLWGAARKCDSPYLNCYPGSFSSMMTSLFTRWNQVCLSSKIKPVSPSEPMISFCFFRPTDFLSEPETSTRFSPKISSSYRFFGDWLLFLLLADAFNNRCLCPGVSCSQAQTCQKTGNSRNQLLSSLHPDDCCRVI